MRFCHQSLRSAGARYLATNFSSGEVRFTAIVPAVISSALDTGIGISHGLALAANQSDLNFDCGLATLSLLESDVVFPALEITAGNPI